MNRETFERLVQYALDELPEEFASRLENVALVVDEEPDPETLREMGLDPVEDADELLGLYQGIPQIERDSAYSGLPDRIVIYMGPILRICHSPQQVIREVKKTVVHEIGHHFGLDDDTMPY